MVLQKLAGNMGIGLHVDQYSYVTFKSSYWRVRSCVCTNVKL